MKLKEAKSSRNRSYIRKLKESSEIVTSPDWAYSKSRNDIENLESALYTLNSCSQNASLVVVENDFFQAAREAREELENPPRKLGISIAKLQLDKLENGPVYEEWSTKPKSQLETLFEELITYYHLDDCEFTFPEDKYEHAVNSLKEREDQRKMIVDMHEKALTRINHLEKQISISEETNKDCEELRKNETHFKEKIKELEEEQNSLLKKLLEYDCAEKHHRFNCSADYTTTQLPTSTYDLSLKTHAESPFYTKLDNSAILVTKPLAMYIQKLLEKIHRFSLKVKRLRDQRNEFKVLYDKLKLK